VNYGKLYEILSSLLDIIIVHGGALVCGAVDSQSRRNSASRPEKLNACAGINYTGSFKKKYTLSKIYFTKTTDA
jgi:hypothetical protein